MESSESHFAFYGLHIAVAGWPEVLEAIGLDFAWFRATAGEEPSIRIRLERGTPSFDGLPAARASFTTTRNVVYQVDHRTIIDYFGRVLVVFDRARGEVSVQGNERSLAHEAIYLLMLNRIGEYLDSAGLMRIHGLGLAGNRGAILLLLPAGGGKSTLALRALRQPDVRLLSDDTPLLDRHGQLHSFPLRLGLDAQAAAALPSDGLRRIERFEFPAKYALAIEQYADRIPERPAALRHIVLGRRSLGEEARLEPIARRRAIAPLLRDGVVGLGIAQMAEYVLQKGWSDVLGKGGVAARRAAICAGAMARASTWEVEFGRDREKNWRALESLLR